MVLSLPAILFWGAGFICHVALLSVLMYKLRVRTVAWFTGWISLQILFTVALFFGYRFGSRRLYDRVYWIGAFLDFLLQIAVALEIADTVFRRAGRWVDGARVRLVIVALSGPIMGGILAWQMTPAATSVVDAWYSRASLFTTVVLCTLFSVIMLASQQVGVGWQTRALKEAYGLITWAIVAFATDTLHAYWRTVGRFTALEDIRMTVYLGSLIYWMFIFWLPERSDIRHDARNGQECEGLRRAARLWKIE